MQKLCPNCNTSQPAVVSNLSDKEILIMRKLEISEQICKQCYIAQLTDMKKPITEELTKLNIEKGIIKTSYDEVCKNYNHKANIFSYIDHNLFLITEGIKKKKPATNKYLKAAEKPERVKSTKIEQLAKKLLGSLSKEQQEAMFKTFQNN